MSLLTKPRRDEELHGLVYALTPKAHDEALAWYQRPATLAIIVLIVTLLLNIIYW